MTFDHYVEIFWLNWLRAPLWFTATVIFCYGAIVGSFLNVCIFRIPLGRSPLKGRSICPRSGQPIPWYDNIPILSYLILRGRGRVSKEPISPQYPLVEAGVAVWFLVTFLLFRFAVPSPYLLLNLWLLGSVLVVQAGIDIQTREIELKSIFWSLLIVWGLALLIPSTQNEHLGVFEPIAWADAVSRSVSGACIAAGVVLLTSGLVSLIVGEDSIGLGDGLVLALIGAVLGWKAATFIFFGGFALAILYVACRPSLRQQLFKHFQEESASTTAEGPTTPVRKALPFVPFLGLGTLLWVVCAPLLKF